MDVSDQATQREEQLLEAALSDQAYKTRLTADGTCKNCGEAVVAGMFCDADCRDDFERRERAARMNGVGYGA